MTQLASDHLTCKQYYICIYIVFHIIKRVIREDNITAISLALNTNIGETDDRSLP